MFIYLWDGHKVIGEVASATDRNKETVSQAKKEERTKWEMANPGRYLQFIVDECRP